MARTAVVNPRNRAGRFTKKRRRNNPSRRRNYGAAALVNPPRRRRRRRHYGAARPHRRRRNPISPYASGGYYRRPNPSRRRNNPSLIDFHDLTETVPAAVAGVWAARFALKQSGSWEENPTDHQLEPGWKQAVAIWIAAQLGGQLVGQMFGSDAKGNAARIAALGWGGDLFMTRRFMRDSKFVQENLSLQGLGEDDDDDQGVIVQGEDGQLYQLSGFQESSPLGSWTDAAGNTWTNEGGQWALSGFQQRSALGAGAGAGAALAGFQQRSALGTIPGGSSFGYSRG